MTEMETYGQNDQYELADVDKHHSSTAHHDDRRRALRNNHKTSTVWWYPANLHVSIHKPSIL